MFHLVVPLILRVELIHVLITAEQYLHLIYRPPGRHLLHFLHVAVTVRGVLGVGAAATPAVETVGVGWCLPVTEVAAVATPSNTAGHSALLYCLADHHAVLLELLGEDGVEEGVAAGVEGQHEHGENFGSFQGYQVETTGSAGREESNWKPVDEVSKH